MPAGAVFTHVHPGGAGRTSSSQTFTAAHPSWVAASISEDVNWKPGTGSAADRARLADLEAFVLDGTAEVVVEPAPQLRPRLVELERRLLAQPLQDRPASPSRHDRRPVKRDLEELDRVAAALRVDVEFIRHLSAVNLGTTGSTTACWSSLSGLTSTYVLVPQSLPTEKRKVAGSIPALATRLFMQIEVL